MKKVLIADSSADFPEMLRKIAAEEWGLEILGIAKTGGELYALLERKPDLLFLDMFLPPMDGFHVIEQIMARTPVATVMTCAAPYPQDCDLFQEALNRGALLVFPKPTNLASARVRLESLRETLLQIAEMPKAQIVADYRIQRAKASHHARHPAHKVIGLVGSTGAVEVLRQVIAALPANLRAGVLVAQHMHGPVWDNFFERLARTVALKPVMGRGGEILREGTVLLSPVDSTLLLGRASCGGVSRLEKTSYEPGQIPLQPNIDAFLASLACYGKGALAVVLSGIGRSGSAGARAIRDAGGEVWVQNPRSALVGSMPGAVQDAGLASRVLDAEAIGPELEKLFL